MYHFGPIPHTLRGQIRERGMWPEFKLNPDLSDSDRSGFNLNWARCLIKRGGSRGKRTQCGTESDAHSEEDKGQGAVKA